MANEPLKLQILNRQHRCHGEVAEMFMANEPLKPGVGGLDAAWGPHVAEMFMANEPLKPAYCMWGWTCSASCRDVYGE